MVHFLDNQSDHKSSTTRWDWQGSDSLPFLDNDQVHALVLILNHLMTGPVPKRSMASPPQSISAYHNVNLILHGLILRTSRMLQTRCSSHNQFQQEPAHVMT